MYTDWMCKVFYMLILKEVIAKHEVTVIVSGTHSPAVALLCLVTYLVTLLRPHVYTNVGQHLQHTAYYCGELHCPEMPRGFSDNIASVLSTFRRAIHLFV